MFACFDNFYLRELRASDLEGNWYNWFNDDKTTKYQNKKIFPNTYEKQKDYFTYLQSSNKDVVFAIVDKKTDTHIGNIGVHNIDYIHRRCEIGIVIGEKDFLGKGIGKQAVEYITKYVFDSLNMNRVSAIIMEQNVASIKAFKGNKFEEEGIMRAYFYKHGRYVNAMLLSRLNQA